MTANAPIQIETKASEIQRIFDLQKKNQFNIGNTTVTQRRAKLKKLHNAILKYRPQIKEALYNDYRKHPSEVDLSEIYPVTSEIKDAKSNLRQWMMEHGVSTPLAMLGSSSHIKYEPKGVVLIVSPWNFPINLTFGPLVSAFNHIFFTGAPSIGKIVMKAAAENLTSVTLELGGKSPTIVDETANIDLAAKRVAWGKYVNNGQVCIAPDYLFVHESKKEEFITAFKKYMKEFYSNNPAQETSYARIVNNRHYHRVKGYVDDAIANFRAYFASL